MQWIEYIQNPEALKHLYDVVPELGRVEMTRIELKRDGPTAVLSLVLPRFPDHPPDRWRRSGFNTASIDLRLFAVSGYTQSGWQTENVIQVRFAQAEESISLTAVGEGIKLDVVCGFIDVASVHGYLRDSP